MAFVKVQAAAYPEIASQQGAAAVPDTPAPEIRGTDLVGFGKNAELTYDTLWANEPGYGIWVINKFTELVKDGEELDTPPAVGDTKIKRLAQWLIEREKRCEEMGPQYEYNDEMEAVLIPSSQTLKDRHVVYTKSTGPKFYGIAAPEKRVCTSWEECKPFVHGVKGVKYRSFPTREEAEAYIVEAGAKAAENEEARKAKEAERETRLAEKEAAKKQKEDEKERKAEEKQKKAEEKTAARKSKKEATEASAEGETAKKRQKMSVVAEETNAGTVGKAKAKGKPKGKARKDAVVMKDAEAAGLASGLKNLAVRPEVAGLGLSLDDLFRTLQACDGLVNKAKAMLLDTGAVTPSKSTTPTASFLDATSTGLITPEKLEQESAQFANECNELSKLLAATA